MVKSMTGYGRGLASSLNKSIEIEFKSVNSKYFDANIRMPKSLFVLEDKIRKEIKEKISRGKIDVFITYKNQSEDTKDIFVNENLASKYINSLSKIQENHNLEGNITLDLIMKLEGILTIEENKEEPEEIFSLIKEALEIALLSHEKMRVKEGENLKSDILNRGSVIREKVDKISELAPNMVPLFREKLINRINELNLKLDFEERIAMEVALFSDRASIDEEITRLYSHLEQLNEILSLGDPIGKKLDFLAQELNREANTMASKSQDIEITKHVLDIKNEIEKIREQIQNIE